MPVSPILVVDDDNDDLDMIKECIEELKVTRPVLYFTGGSELEQYLLEAPIAPFLIVCDLNLPLSDGFDIRDRMAHNKELKYKSVPFIFWSTDATEKQIQYAYDLPAQGFFFKPHSFGELCITFKTILDYWSLSSHPKSIV